MNRKLKTKHSKVRNTGLLFEFLLRQLTVDVLNNTKNSIALNIIKKRFNENTELGKELQLYNILLKTKFKSDKKADFLIAETINSRVKLNNQLLKRERYNLIKEIKNKFDISNFLSSRINNYKTYASIYKLFENISNMNPEEKTEVYFNVLENITSNFIKSSDVPLGNLLNYKKELNESDDVRILSYKILLEKFNKKYSHLNGSQKSLLRAYINNISNTNSLKEYIEDKTPNLKKELKKYSRNIKDRVVKIKLKESINLLDDLLNEEKKKLIDDKIVVSFMRYYELLKELKK
tara:strand:+ start:1020 stop:1895 length:876 start_codon:yes stop_codon:yes gene_type:complete